MMLAVRNHICWCCGEPLHKNLVFAIGPMCAITRTTSEPPSHAECARFAVKACPFLTKPRMRRAPRDPEGTSAAGIQIERNPGVVLLWATRTVRLTSVSEAIPGAEPGVLFRVGDPIWLESWAEGRQATNAELVESIRTGLPELIKLAREDKDPEGAFKELAAMLNRACRILGLTDLTLESNL